MGVAMTGTPSSFFAPAVLVVVLLSKGLLERPLWFCLVDIDTTAVKRSAGVDELNRARVGSEHGVALEGAVLSAMQLLVCALEVEGSMVPALLVGCPQRAHISVRPVEFMFADYLPFAVTYCLHKIVKAILRKAEC
jgi:hypothetical protein